MSDSAPVALVFEDLQWADPALLDFLEYLIEWSRARADVRDRAGPSRAP